MLSKRNLHHLQVLILIRPSFEALDALGNILPDASKESVGKYIPKDAPPRPSAHAEWDNDYQQWVEE